MRVYRDQVSQQEESLEQKNRRLREITERLLGRSKGSRVFE